MIVILSYFYHFIFILIAPFDHVNPPPPQFRMIFFGKK